MSDAVVVFDSVWKKFRRGERHNSLRDLVPATFKRLTTRRAPGQLEAEEFWAVHDVSFEVQKGQALGIIGPNGAGKSTTLKLLTRILRPTRGHCEVRGRVGALIEVAAGFHPDLTGRENIFLQGSIMGMRRHEIASRLDAIVDFAGVGDFIDTQVKRYSSGMNARLGFAVAAHLNPDVLIIDEVLSVGDMAFQERCIARMKEFRQAGVTIVFVSHNLQAVATLCDRALRLERRCKALGPTQEVIESYVSATRENTVGQGTGEIEITTSELLGVTGLPPFVVSPGADLTLRVTYEGRQEVADLTFGFLLYRSTDQLLVYDGNVRGRSIGLDTIPVGQSATVDFKFRPHLTRGQYHVECFVFHNPTQHFFSRLSPAASFSVSEFQTYAGIADIELGASVVASGARRTDTLRTV